MARGFFITLEGGEGVGKSTQARRLVARLEAAGWPARATREPGGSPKAEAIRALLLSGAALSLGPAAEAILFTAARIDHIDGLIRPTLAAGISVVSDRFADSTRVYQGVNGHVERGIIHGLETVAVGATRPDLTIMLDLSTAVGLARAAARRAGTAPPDRFERETLAFHDNLRTGFLAIAQADPGRCAVVDASGTAEAVAAAIWDVAAARLPALAAGRS